jgi:putative ABC transport system permease protein
MFRNYLIISFRNVLRHKGYSFINIAGLAIGMAICILIMLWVIKELSYDRYHANADHIYRLCMDANIGGNQIQAPISNSPAASAMIQDFPEVIDAVRIQPQDKVLVELGSKRFYEENVAYADNSIFNVFSFPMISGDPKTALATAYSIVLTRSMAEKYFGDEDPIGKTLRLNGEHDFTITGIVQDVPINSHFTFDMLCSFQTLYQENGEYLEQWLEFSYATYLLLPENSDYQALEQKFPAFIDRYMGKELTSLGSTIDFFLQPLTDIHLYSNMNLESSGNGDIANIYLFSGIALFVLLIACFNFINLSTARSSMRAKEVGVRKTFGAPKGKLIQQFLGESLIYSFLSLILAVILLEIFVPLFNSITQDRLTVNYFHPPWLIPGLAALALIVGLVAGIYPAFFLSSFKPIRVFKGNLRLGAANVRFRSVLVVSQFAISIALIIGTFTIYDQLLYMRHKKLGFAKDQVLVITEVNDAPGQALHTLKYELAKITGVVSVSETNRIPGEDIRKSVFVPEGYSEDQAQMMDHTYADPDYIPTLGIEMAAGRNFSADLATDTSESVIINETAARKFGWDNPVGKIIKTPNLTENGLEWIPKTVIGVVKDFHITSLHLKIEPIIIRYLTTNPELICVKVSGDDITHTINLMKKKWDEIYPSRPMDYFFLDESFDRMYRSDERLGKIALSFAVLAIFVGCLGLFGMSSFTAERRTKEIGIRKTLGASVGGIVGLLSREFMVLVIIANALAWPIGYYAMHKWLQDFAYHINLSVVPFVFAGLLALLIALATVCFQAIKAALANPANALKYE